MLSLKPLLRRKNRDTSDDVYKVATPGVARPCHAQIPTANGTCSRSETDFQLDRAHSSKPPLLSSALIFFLGVALWWYSARQGVMLGEIAAPILTLASLHGLWRGGFRKLVMLGVSVGVLYAAFSYPNFADPVVKAITGSSSGLASGIITVLVVVLTLVIAGMLVKRFRQRHIASRPVMLGVDRLMGTGVGLTEGAFIVLSLCWVAVMIQPHARLVRDHQNITPDSIRHRLATALVQLADEARAEPLGAIVESTNLIEKMPAMRDAINELNTTGQFNLDNIDPEVMEKLNELLQQSPNGGLDVGNLGPLIEQYKQGNEARDKVYKQLPSPSGTRR